MACLPHDNVPWMSLQDKVDHPLEAGGGAEVAAGPGGGGGGGPLPLAIERLSAGDDAQATLCFFAGVVGSPSVKTAKDSS
eukprot:11154338-Lingulodinium_polyedra.AAC.1